jgi:hypothetical protein
MYGDITSEDGATVLPKNYEALCIPKAGTDTTGRISIRHKEHLNQIINQDLPSELNLDGTVYAACEEFVVAFNAMIATGSGLTPAGGAGVAYNNVDNQTLDNVAPVIFAADTYHRIFVMVEGGSVTVSVAGGSSVAYIQGQSFEWQADGLIAQAVTIDSTGGGKCHVVTEN